MIHFIKNCFPKVFLEKYNFNDSIEIYSDSCIIDSDEEYSDDSDEENSDEKIQTKKTECINLFLEETRIIW